MELIQRNYCVYSGKKDLEHLYTIPHFPVYLGCSTLPFKDDLFTDMSWWISEGTGSIQLNPLIPLDILYQDQHNAVVGDIWKQHHYELANFIHKYHPQNVLEIGGAHGFLASHYLKKELKAEWTIVEPNPNIVEGSSIKIIKTFFDKKFPYSDNYDAIIHSHLIEHIYDPREIVESIYNKIPLGCLHIFSLPNLHYMFDNYYTNSLNFEHTLFMSEPYVEALLNNYGFVIEEKHYFNNHSIFYAARKTSDNLINVKWPSLYQKNKMLFLKFIDYYTKTVEELNYKTNSHKGEVYIFGAHIFSQFLLAFGLESTQIHSVLDNNVNKIGKRLYGTKLKVDSPSVLKKATHPMVILKAGHYNDEIKNDILTHINDDVIFAE
jgi:hypothetical protein